MPRHFLKDFSQWSSPMSLQPTIPAYFTQPNCLRGHKTKANVIFKKRIWQISRQTCYLLSKRPWWRWPTANASFQKLEYPPPPWQSTPEREIRRCYNCCRYGHLASKCRSKLRCGRCSMSHQTHECTSETLRCCNCNGSDISGSQSCPEQQKEIMRYTTLFY